MWSALDLICDQEKTDIHSLCTWISTYKPRSNRTSAIRAFIVSYLRSQLEGMPANVIITDDVPCAANEEISDRLRQIFAAG